MTRPPSFEEALERSARGARAAASEALGALHALAQAVSLLANGTAAARLGELAGRFAAGGEGQLLAALAEILDAEVARWRERARGDADARVVLRVFLALRALLSEAGARPATPRSGSGRGPARPRPRPARARRQVQRVRVEG